MSVEAQHTARFYAVDTAYAAGESDAVGRSSWVEVVVTVTLTMAAVTGVSVIAVVLGLA